ncbi:MAG: hypothetical protein IPN97_08120 [Saprospiraceae bacterium]|nr:hypothetical protein [Saprospiraceae bacterium]
MHKHCGNIKAINSSGKMIPVKAVGPDASLYDVKRIQAWIYSIYECGDDQDVKKACH